MVDKIWRDLEKGIVPEKLINFIEQMAAGQFIILLNCLPGRTMTTLASGELKIRSLAIEELNKIADAYEFEIAGEDDLVHLLQNLAIHEIGRRVKRNSYLKKAYGFQNSLGW